ncbi:hypothetical protein A3J90_01860 [candidate division WOR-1 bacterium RIFOXYC2_FULL_37_10]|uniref:Oxidoreductase n=1 Tax=candidate division WOR-1 bacterium RIFOXYB2_FULL_37_13 TaxID=1802579 RepID=A0A1F4SNY9_UNCSA|nr:MAG: hypothetical protein A2310_04860 [candidate division WOR-1 bacterium RIFOXYB2_FULL_37_13]OGC35074.1 MAG: hypothetical protein A3J90_01860 [candidate division WOR-1 bacterium RIFOXYC2_FULL_37_10]
MDKGKLRLGLVGCGNSIKYMFGPYFRYVSNCDFYGAFDIEEEKAKEAQKLYGAKVIYKTYDELLKDTNIDAVMICTPTHLHKQQVVMAAKAKKHIFCEKPMTINIKDADEMIAACNAVDVKLMIGFNRRFNKGYIKVKKIIEKKELGDVFEIRARWDKAHAKPTGYREKVYAGGGFLQEDGSHPIDLLSWWLGDVEEVSANILLVASNMFENEDVAQIMLKHKTGQISSLNASRLTHLLGEEVYEIYGTRGTLIVKVLGHDSPWTQPPQMYIYRKGKFVEDITLYNSWSLDEELKENWQYSKELEHFCDCVLSNKEPAINGVKGRNVVEIVNAAYLSHFYGKKITLPISEFPDFEKIFKDLSKKSKLRIGWFDGWWAGY